MTNPNAAVIKVETVKFASEETYCAADIYYPPGATNGSKLAAVIIAQGFTGVKEVSNPAASFFASNGYLACAIDYRHFGASGGSPRGQLFPLRQVEDIRNAVSYLESRGDVDPRLIGLWGTSFAGGTVIYAAATDRRIRAVISQVPVINGWRWAQALRTTSQWEALLDALEEDRRRRFGGEKGRRIPGSALQVSDVISGYPANQEVLDLLGEFAKAVPSWSPEITLESLEKIIEYSPEDLIDRIAPRALLMVTVSGYDITHPTAEILRAFERALQPKEILILPYAQLDLYSGDGLATSLKHQLDFLRRHLARPDR